jgi:hypothetical protein
MLLLEEGAVAVVVPVSVVKSLQDIFEEVSRTSKSFLSEVDVEGVVKVVEMEEVVVVVVVLIVAVMVAVAEGFKEGEASG